MLGFYCQQVVKVSSNALLTAGSEEKQGALTSELEGAGFSVWKTTVGGCGVRADQESV